MNKNISWHYLCGPWHGSWNSYACVYFCGARIPETKLKMPFCALPCLRSWIKSRHTYMENWGTFSQRTLLQCTVCFWFSSSYVCVDTLAEWQVLVSVRLTKSLATFWTSARYHGLFASFKRHFWYVKSSWLTFWVTVCKTVRPMLSVCPVCNVRALWPNGWSDQDETWRAGRPRPWSLCVRWGPSSPSPDICCSQTAGWIKMPIATWYGGRPQPRRLCVRWEPSPLNFLPMFIIVIVISLEHCRKHSRYWFIQVQVLYSMHFIFRKV